MFILEIVLGVSLISWLGLAIFLIWNFRGTTILRPHQIAELPVRPPGISILVPARNEEDALGATLESLLQLEYPEYEVIVVDDASTDQTGRIAEEWAARPESRRRLRVIHSGELPAGWSGKVHALSLAARAATGEWILSTDADVVFHPAALKLAISCALQREVQLFSMPPEFELGGFWEKAVLPAFTLLPSTVFPLRLVNRPESTRALAAGAFTLMRLEDFEALGAYESLKSVVNEDVRTAEMFKRNGRRIFLAASRGLLRTRMYSGLGELWEGLSRSAFEGTGFSVAKTLAGVAVGMVTSVLPWAALIAFAFLPAPRAAWAQHAPVTLLAGLTCLVSTLVYLPMILYLGENPFFVFTLPLAAVFYIGVALNSMWQGLFGDGVEWKGRRYRPPS